jgi:hypothetical protein
MNKITNVTNVIDINFDKETLNAFKKTTEVLTELRKELGRPVIIKALETGEVIQMDEIPRVLGILHGLTEFRAFELEVDTRVLNRGF